MGVVAGNDCDDDGPAASATYPGAAEIDGPLNCMKDADDDGFGDDAVSLPIVRGTDCNDDFTAVNPEATEGPQGDATCSDGLDNDCDTLTDAADNQCSTLRRRTKPGRFPTNRPVAPGHLDLRPRGER